MKEDITKRIDALNDELATRQESIDLLKGRLKNQITSFRETIAKALDKEPLWLKRSELCLESKELQFLPYSQLSGWPSGYLLKHYYQAVGGAAAASGGGEPPPKDEKGLKEWVRSKLKALAFATREIRYESC